MWLMTPHPGEGVRMNRLTSRLSLVGLAAALSLSAACSSSQRGADPENPYQLDVAVLAANEFYSIPWLVGQKRGFFEEHGVKVGKIVAGSGGSATLRTQLSGDLPIGEVGYNSVLHAAKEGVPLVAVGGGVQNTHGGEYYARKDNDEVNKLADIRSWAYTNPGSSIYALSFMILEEAGLPTKAERVAAGGVGEGVALLEAGKVDVAWLPPTLASRHKDDFKLVVRTHDYVDKFQASVITTSPRFAKDHPDVVKAVLAGYQEAIKWATGNPEETAKLYAAHVDVSYDAALEVVKGATGAVAWNIGFNPESLKSGTKSAELSGLKGGVDYCGLFDGSFLPRGATAELPTDCS
ncbi:ABC transporter substrate-binding protein [Actinomadura madurae]|nr:ABC transporter substrate-binding protein [Actinomadura madurae]